MEVQQVDSAEGLGSDSEGSIPSAPPGIKALGSRVSEQEPERYKDMKMLEMEYEAEVSNALRNLKSYELRDLEQSCSRITEFLLNVGIVSEDVLTMQGLIKSADQSVTRQENEAALASKK